MRSVSLGLIDPSETDQAPLRTGDVAPTYGLEGLVVGVVAKLLALGSRPGDGVSRHSLAVVRRVGAFALREESVGARVTGDVGGAVVLRKVSEARGG